MPFVQGHLRHESLRVSFRTECAHCHQQMQVDIGHDLSYRVDGEGARPLVFVPDVNFAKLKDPSIIDVF